MSYILAFSRWLLPVLTVILLVKCLMTLLLGRPTKKTYGYLIDLADGERYALNMWETAIGRSATNDIVIGYPTISRNQAVISRRVDGWYIYDLRSKSGIAVNGEPCEQKTVIRGGDVLTLGNMNFRFTVVNDPVIRVGKHKKKSAAPLPAQPVRTRPTAVQTPQTSQPLFTSDFYDEEHKPQLHFNPVHNVPQYKGAKQPSGPVYSGVNPSYTGEQHIQTPARQNAKPIRVPRPTLINADSGTQYILTGNTVSVGRAKGCDIVLPEPTVSRRHATLLLYEDGWAITDNNSAHGTFLNGVRVTAPQLLFDGDTLTLADATLKFRS